MKNNIYHPISVILSLLIFNSCSPMWPEMAKTIDDIATDDIIEITVGKNAINQKTNVKISLDVINKEL